MKRITPVFVLALLAFCFHSCEKYVITYEYESFSTTIEPIFVDNCASCHTTLPPDFTEGTVFTTLTQYNGGSLLNLESPDESYLFEKASGSHGGVLTNGQIEQIKIWMENGTPND